MLGTVSAQKVELCEVHRFPNLPLQQTGTLTWDIQALWQSMLEGLTKAASLKVPIRSISCDSWGLDYLLFDNRDNIIEPAYHYRDSRTTKGQEIVFSQISREEIFEETGIQFMPINTLYQMAAESRHRIERASRIMLIADAFNFLLSGVAANEVTMASTTQFYNPRKKNWSAKLLGVLGLDKTKLAPLINPGTLLGPLKKEVSRLTGLPAIPVVATCSHDTGAAVAAISDTGDDWAYLSSGTWSLLGVVLEQPLITPIALKYNFTNEVGYGGTIRLLKNIAGLWLLQECRREWKEAGQQFEYRDLTKLAEEAGPAVSTFDVRDQRFWSPGNMTEKIRSYCKEHSIPCPSTHGEFVRCILESLAAAYARTIQEIEEVTGRKITRLHIVGGGSQNQLLNELTGKACAVEIIAGPSEATAMGNILVQHRTFDR